VQMVGLGKLEKFTSSALVLPSPRSGLPMLLCGTAEVVPAAFPPVSYLSVPPHLKFHSTPQFCRLWEAVDVVGRQ
jgi:hypothetical protein